MKTRHTFGLSNKQRHERCMANIARVPTRGAAKVIYDALGERNSGRAAMTKATEVEPDLLPCWTCRGRTFAEISHSSQDHGWPLYRCINCKAVYPERALAAPSLAPDPALSPDKLVAGSSARYVPAESQGYMHAVEIVGEVEGWYDVRFSDGSTCIVRPSHLLALATKEPTDVS